MGRLHKKNAIITGAAGYENKSFSNCSKFTNDDCRGIGLETTIQFVIEGANVLMSDINEAGLKKALESVISYVGKDIADKVKLEYKVADVSKEGQVKSLVGHVEPWGGVDVMFNNAGIMHPQDDGVLNTEEKIWDLTQAINVKGVFFGCKHAIDSMLNHGKKNGSIINTGSFVGLMGAATPQIAYTASKGAVLAMTRELVICYARQGIRVNSLCPGPLNTPLLQAFLDTEERS